MEEDEDYRSGTRPAGYQSPDSSSLPVTQSTEVTVAAVGPPRPPPSPPTSSSPQNVLAVIPAQAATGGGGNSSSGRGNGGGREDCWSEGATAVLIDAWGERFLGVSRGNLRKQQWQEVAEVVSSREDYGKTPKNDIQCKNRIDTVKKKYKQEKARMAAGGGPSRWIFFEKLDRLIGDPVKFSSSGISVGDEGSSQKVPMGIPLNSLSDLYQCQAKTTTTQPLLQQPQAAAKRSNESTRWRFRKRSASETESESEPEHSADSADSLPPPPPPPKRVKIEKRESGGGRVFKELARAVLTFCEAYEKAEMAKLKQMMETEKERMKFMKELEMQKMEFFGKTQMEISQLKQHRRNNNGEGGGGGGNKHTNIDRSGKNNSDVSS